MLQCRLTNALAVAALGLGIASLPAVAAPASKPTNSTADLASALKTVRPITVELLEQDEVLADMKCSDDQRKAIAELIKKARDEHQAALQQPAVGAGGGRLIVRAISTSPIKYDTEKLAATLKPEQLNRVRQLELHLRGPQAFFDRRVARALKLSVEQELKLEAIVLQFEPELASTAAKIRGRNADAKPLAELGEKFTARCLDVLTKEQRASWEWLVGKRPEAGQWAQAGAPAATNGVGMIAIQGGAIRIAPALPIAPPPPPPPPPKK